MSKTSNTIVIFFSVLTRLKQSAHSTRENISSHLHLKNRVKKINNTYELYTSNGRKILKISLKKTEREKNGQDCGLLQRKLTNENNKTKNKYLKQRIKKSI